MASRIQFPSGAPHPLSPLTPVATGRCEQSDAYDGDDSSPTAPLLGPWACLESLREPEELSAVPFADLPPLPPETTWLGDATKPYPTAANLLQRYQVRWPAELLHRLALHIALNDGRFSEHKTALVGQLGQAGPFTEADRQRLGECFDSLNESITHDLVGLIVRHTDNVVCGDMLYTQRFGHVERANGVSKLVNDTTLSSLGIKKDGRCDNAFMRGFNANLGALSAGTKLLLVRSARTDTAERLEELLLFGAIKAREAHRSWDGASGMHRGDDGVWEYRGVIISALDLSRLKEMGTQLVGGEVETTMLHHQREAVEALFGQNPSIVRTLEHGEKVRLRRPLLLNLPFSNRANHHTIGASHHYNRGAAKQFALDLAARWRTSDDAQLRALAPDVVALPASLFVALQAPHYERQRMALEGLKILSNGSDSRGDHYDHSTDPERELLLLAELIDQAGLVPHCQCKSGLDRTATLMATLVASTMYAQKTYETYCPLEGSVCPHQELLYKELFTDAIDILGCRPIDDVRGVTGQWKGLDHPVPVKRYLPSGVFARMRNAHPGSKPAWRAWDGLKRSVRHFGFR